MFIFYACIDKYAWNKDILTSQFYSLQKATLSLVLKIIVKTINPKEEKVYAILGCGPLICNHNFLYDSLSNLWIQMIKFLLLEFDMVWIECLFAECIE
jgi:hypothetical protein